MEPNKLIKVSKIEAQIIDHRLGVPDAIAEACELPLGTVEDICEKFEEQLKQGFIHYSGETEEEVFEDILDGSTWLAGMRANYEADSLTQSQWANACRAVYTLEDKTGWYIPKN